MSEASIILYNKVPKCGSTTFRALMRVSAYLRLRVCSLAEIKRYKSTIRIRTYWDSHNSMYNWWSLRLYVYSDLAICHWGQGPISMGHHYSDGQNNWRYLWTYSESTRKNGIEHGGRNTRGKWDTTASQSSQECCSSVTPGRCTAIYNYTVLKVYTITTVHTNRPILLSFTSTGNQ